MKRYILAILLFLLIIPCSEAQMWKKKRYEIILGAGPTQFFGDVGGFTQGTNWAGIKDLSFTQSSFNANLGLNYRTTRRFTTRFNLSYGSLRASDVKGSNEDRGFVVTTSIIEPTLIGQFYLSRKRSERSFMMQKTTGGVFGGFFKAMSLYAFTGAGGLYYNVKPNDKLQERTTVTNGWTAVIPVGIGGSIYYNPNLCFGFEFGGRYSFTDNLDGYTSQYSNSNDVYYFLNFTIGFRLKSSSKGLPSFR
jgi:hypothetical protein